MVFKKSSFTGRRYNISEIAFCIAKKRPSNEWVNSSLSEMNKHNVEMLHKHGDVQYFGWL